MKKFYTVLAALSLSMAAFAQKNVILTIQHKLGNANFSYNTTNFNDVGSIYKFNRVEYYMSGFAYLVQHSERRRQQMGQYHRLEYHLFRSKL
jgi:hypothetical protein